MAKYDTVIFDLDGTLLDTLEDLKDCINFVMKKYSFSQKTLDEIRSFVGNGLRRLLELCLPDGESNPRFDEIYDDFFTYYKAHCNIKTKPYNGVQQLIKELTQKGYKLAIVSNKTDYAVTELNKLYFGIGVTVGAKDGLAKKPAPDTVNYALKQLSSAHNTSIYIGDSEVDKATADNAGLDCVLVSWGFRDKAFLAQLAPLGLIDTPQEIYNYLD